MIFFAFCIRYNITCCFFLSGYIWLKYWNIIPSICLIRSRNQNDWTNIYPLFPGFDVRYGLGNILYSSSLINCGYLVAPIVESYINNDTVWLFGLLLSSFWNVYFYMWYNNYSFPNKWENLYFQNKINWLNKIFFVSVNSVMKNKLFYLINIYYHYLFFVPF